MNKYPIYHKNLITYQIQHRVYSSTFSAQKLAQYYIHMLSVNTRLPAPSHWVFKDSGTLLLLFRSYVKYSVGKVWFYINNKKKQKKKNHLRSFILLLFHIVVVVFVFLLIGLLVFTQGFEFRSKLYTPYDRTLLHRKWNNNDYTHILTHSHIFVLVVVVVVIAVNLVGIRKKGWHYSIFKRNQNK